VLEAAFVPATGLHYRPWEIRNLLVPRLLVAPVLSLVRALGVRDPFVLVRLAALPEVALSAVNGWLVYRLTARLTARLADRWTAALAAAVFSFHWLPLAYGGTVYPRTASTTCVILAALLVASAVEEKDGEAGRIAPLAQGIGFRPLARGIGIRPLARGLAAGALVALAFADRYSEAVFLAPLAAFALWPRAGRTLRAWWSLALAIGLGFALGSLLTVGLADQVFWGKPFASLVAFARFTLVERRSSSLVTHQPPAWYLTHAYVWLPPTLLPFFFALRRRRELLLPWLGVALPLLLLSLVHHKELRYLEGCVPFLAILAAAGAAALWRAGWRRTTAVLLLISLLLSLNTARAVLSRRSLAAVAAARELAAGPAIHTVALSQAWAYGHLLFFDNRVGVIDLATPPGEAEVRAAVQQADALGLYAEDLARAPEIERIVAGAGFARAAELRAWNSKPVVVFRRTAG
jgi:4-amino-4-deoxy-L-arabinose transferase-like glycosyltransferase